MLCLLFFCPIDLFHSTNNPDHCQSLESFPPAVLCLLFWHIFHPFSFIPQLNFLLFGNKKTSGRAAGLSPVF